MKTNFILNNKIIGWTEGETFYSVRTKEHFFIKFDGWGASVSILSELQNKDIKYYCVIFNGMEFRCRVTDFYNFGEAYVDRYNGKEDLQRILPLKFWNRDDLEIQEKING